MKYIIHLFLEYEEIEYMSVVGIVEAENIKDIQAEILAIGKPMRDAHDARMAAYNYGNNKNKLFVSLTKKYSEICQSTVNFRGREFPMYNFYHPDVFIITPLDEFIQKHTL